VTCWFNLNTITENKNVIRTSDDMKIVCGLTKKIHFHFYNSYDVDIYLSSDGIHSVLMKLDSNRIKLVYGTYALHLQFFRRRKVKYPYSKKRNNYRRYSNMILWPVL
jgi:hypothetical protein